MRKGIASLVALSLFSVVPRLSADIVVEAFTQPGTGKVASGYVLQGSRNMKDLGKKRALSGVRFPALTTLSPTAVPTVLPALRNEALKPQTPKPRFGFGSDYQPGEVVVTPQEIPHHAPAFSFAPIYPSPRIYAYRSAFTPFPLIYSQRAPVPCHPFQGYPYVISHSYAGAFSGSGRLAFSFQSPSFRYVGFR